MKRLAVIDGKSVFYRGYYAMPGLATKDGTPTGGVFGFASLAIELIKKLEPDYVAVAWDKPKTNIRKRKEIYPEYKAGRKPAPPDFYEQIPILHELLEAFGWPLYELDDYEADDILGTFAVQAEAKGIETCLLTSDLDALQLIAPHTKVYALKNGLSNIEEFDVAHLHGMFAADLAGDARHRIGMTAAVERGSRIVEIDSFQRGGEAVRIALAAHLAIGHDVDAGALLHMDRHDRRIVLRFVEEIGRGAPQFTCADARRKSPGQPCAIDQPVWHRIGTDQRGGQQLVHLHSSPSISSSADP